MAIKKYAGDKIVGLSSDTKPTNVSDGATYYESDTKKIYLKISGVWTALTSEEADTLQTVTDRGATTDNIITVPGTQINVAATPAASAPGLIQWNTVDGTYDMGLLNSSVLQVGQETMFYGKASGAIANGDVCQFAGVQGDHILIKKAVGSEIEANPHYLVGVATENIANGTFGYVTWFGKINGIYTKTPANQDNADWVAGDILYFNVTTGQMTKTVPSVPHRVITIAAVIKAQTGSSESGIIIVRPMIGKKLSELDDVNGTPLATDGQIPVWNNTGKYFDFDYNITNYALATDLSGKYNIDQTTPQTVTNGPVDVTGKETTITVDDVSSISLSPTYPTQVETSVSDVSDNSSYIDTAGGSFAYASEQFYIYAYKTAPDLTRVYSAIPASIYLEDQTGSYFQYLLNWQDASAEGYVIYSSYNNYWLDVGNTTSCAVSDSSFSGWNYGGPSTTPSSPYTTYSSNGSLTYNQEWYVYGMNSSEVTSVYSANGAYNADSDPYSSGSGWTEELSWSAATGATSYIVYNSTSGYWIQTTNLSIIDDGSFSGWTSGTPTVTPTSPQTFYKNLFHGENSVAEFTVDGAGNITSSGSITIDGTVNASNIIPEAPIDGKQYAREDGAWSEVVTPVQAKSLQLSGDFRGMYISSAYWKLIDMESGTSAYPSGVTITRIYVKANVADPTTELNANINYCDAQGTGVFPSTNPTLIRAIDTTTGNYDSGAISVSVATNKIIYLEFDTDPTDFAVTYSLVINYVVN